LRGRSFPAGVAVLVDCFVVENHRRVGVTLLAMTLTVIASGTEWSVAILVDCFVVGKLLAMTARDDAGG